MLFFVATGDEDDDALDPDEFIEDYGPLTLRLIITYRWSSDEETGSERAP